MPATRPEAAPIPGRFIRLDPMSHEDAPALAAALHRPEVFAGGYGGGPSAMPKSSEDFAAFLMRYYRAGGPRLNFVARLVGGPSDGAVAGASSLGDLDEQNEAAHLGWTAYRPEVWGTAVNVEAKLLLLGLAFQHGYSRVKIQADAMNERSRAAILRLGAVPEGVIRHERRRPDGSWRDTAVYSILVEEWPGVRAGLEARLAAWGERPVTL